MNEAKSTTEFEVRDQLRRECTRLSDQCNWLERKLVTADNELEAARKEIETLKYRVTVLSDISGENNLLRCQAEEKLASVQAELEAARKVADAAVAASIAWHAYQKISAITPMDYDAKAELYAALNPTRDAVNAAVREYRKLMEGEM